MKHVTLRIFDTHGTTSRSLLLWHMTRPLFGDFREAECGDVDPRLELACDLDLVHTGADPNFTYGLILRDDRSQELWLSGCSAGYGGEGPDGTESILKAEGFPRSHVALVEVYSSFHVRKDRAEPLHVGDAQ